MDAREVLVKYKNGEMSLDEAELYFRREPFEELEYAKLDTHRKLRSGFAEVVFCSGKADAHLLSIFKRLYEEEGVKPSSGCLWSFLPLPFLMVLYAIVRQPLTYLMNMTQDQFNVVSNLLYGNVLDYRNEQLRMAQDVFLNHDKIVAAVPELANMPQIDFTFLGVNLSQTPHFMFWKADDIGAAFGLWLIPVISAALGVVSMIVTNKINAKVLGTQRTMDQSTRMTMFIMPLFSLWICFTLPAALGVYWIANSLFAMLQEVLNIPFLRSFLKKQEEAKVKRREEEKERVKREKQAQAEAKKKAAEEMRRIQMERKLNKSIATASREGIRAYARGRLYDPERYPTFPYQDPNDLAKQAQEEQQRLAEEQKTAKAKGKKGKKDQPNQPTKTEKPAQAAQEEKPSAAPTSAAPEKPVPQPAPVPEEEEGFVEESFLEEPEQDNDEK